MRFSWGGFERVFGVQTGQEAIDAGGAGQPIAFWRYLLNSVWSRRWSPPGRCSSPRWPPTPSPGCAGGTARRVFAVFLAGLMIPAVFTLLPNFVLIKQLGLVDTVLGIALPTMLMTPFAVFFLRQFFLGISREVEEAALVEGASKIRVFFRLILPISAAPIATLSS